MLYALCGVLFGQASPFDNINSAFCTPQSLPSEALA